MNDVNSVCISGRLTKDPIVRNNGKAAAMLAVASNEHYYDKAGTPQERTAFVLAKVFGGLAQTIQCRRKGDTVIVTGKLRTERRDDHSRQSQLVLICDSVHFLAPALSQSSGPDAGDASKNEVDGNRLF